MTRFGAKLRSGLRKLHRDWQRFGASGAVLGLADELLGRVSRAHILVMRVYDAPAFDGKELENDSRYTIRLVSRTELLAATPPELKCLTLSREFVEHAMNKGDVCMGIFDGAELVSYQWYACTATEMFDGITIDVGAPFLYAYNAFTAPAHRGLRLHSLGLLYAGITLAVPQRKQMVSYINSDNTASRLSGTRLPMREGALLLWPRRGGLWILQTHFCRSLNLRLRAVVERASDKVMSH